MNNENTRNILLDNLKGFVIFTVVLGHTFEWYTPTSLLMKFTHDLIYQFHMPLFIFISGYFSKNIEKIKDKIIPDLVIPYIVFQTLYMVLLYFSTGQQKFDIFTPQFAFWYLVVLAFYRGFLPYITNIKFILPIMIMLGLAVGFHNRFDTFLSLSRTISFFWFFLLGYYCKDNDIVRIRSINKFAMMFLFLFCLAIFTYFHKTKLVPLEITMTFPYSDINPLLDLAGRAITYFLATIIGLFLIAVFPSKKCFLTNIGQRSLMIYLFHGFVIGIVRLTNPFAVYPVINTFFLCGFSILITWLLSFQIIEILYRTVMNVINKTILKIPA